MAVIKEGNLTTKKEIDQLVNFKNLLTSNLEWCKWAGWIDTDGVIQILKHKNRPNQSRVALSLRDRQPVEMLSDFFKTSLYYYEYKTITPEPYRREYIAKIFSTYLYGDRAICMTKNIYPYLLNESKKQYAIKFLGYEPESKKIDDWTKEEFTRYLATVIEGDGCVHKKKTKKRDHSLRISIKSSNVDYLSNLKYLLDKHFNLCTVLKEVCKYKTKNGFKHKYEIYIDSKQYELFKLLTRDNVMTLDRKKNKIVEYLSQ